MPPLPDVEPDQQDPQVHLAPNTDMLIAQARLADQKLLAQATSKSEVAQIASSIAKHRPKRRQPKPNGKGEKTPKTKRADRKITKQKHTLEFKRAPRSGSTKLKSEGSPGVRTPKKQDTSGGCHDDDGDGDGDGNGDGDDNCDGDGDGRGEDDDSDDQGNADDGDQEEPFEVKTIHEREHGKGTWWYLVEWADGSFTWAAQSCFAGTLHSEFDSAHPLKVGSDSITKTGYEAIDCKICLSNNFKVWTGEVYVPLKNCARMLTE